MNRLKVLIILAFLVLAAPSVLAQSPDLSALTAQLTKVRATHGINQMRDAGPELTQVKQTLRAWIEQQLPPVPQPGQDGIIYGLDPRDVTKLGDRLSQALDDAKLTCGTMGTADYRCNSAPTDYESDRGYVDKVLITPFEDDRYLMVITGVGVVCGYDQSAYLYEQGDDHKWRLLLSIEQDNYGKDDYKPQNFLSLDVSGPQNPGDDHVPQPLVTAVGYEPWCSSNWNTLTTRLWRATPATTTPHALLDRDDELYTGDDFIAGARLTDHDLLVQFDGRSIDGDVLVRQHVLHYAIGPSDTLTRIAPMALDPGDFVEEWLSSPWPEASHWLSPDADHDALSRLHATAYNPDLYGEFDGAPKQCRKDPTLWQGSFAADGDKPEAASRPNYFQVRWLPPYDLTLVAAGSSPFPGCDKDVAPSTTPATLFPVTGWTPQ